MTGTVAADPSRQEQYLRQAVDALGGIGEKNVYCYPKLCQAAAFIEQSFRDAGYQPTRHEYQARDKSFANIEAEIRGQDSPQDIVIVGAHYDTARGSPGANDNGSGVAALLALVRSLVNERSSRSLRFVAFTNEERPFLRTAAHGQPRLCAAMPRARRKHKSHAEPRDRSATARRKQEVNGCPVGMLYPLAGATTLYLLPTHSLKRS